MHQSGTNVSNKRSTGSIPSLNGPLLTVASPTTKCHKPHGWGLYYWVGYNLECCENNTWGKKYILFSSGCVESLVSATSWEWQMMTALVSWSSLCEWFASQSSILFGLSAPAISFHGLDFHFICFLLISLQKPHTLPILIRMPLCSRWVSRFLFQ